jgi:hypothetical protein
MQIYGFIGLYWTVFGTASWAFHGLSNRHGSANFKAAIFFGDL